MIKTNEALNLHMALKNAKVGKLDKEKTIAYLKLKTELTDIKDVYEKKLKSFNEETMALYGLKDGDKMDESTGREYYSAINGLNEKLLEDECNINTRIFNDDDLYDSILSLDKNEDITSESKAMIMNLLINS